MNLYIPSLKKYIQITRKTLNSIATLLFLKSYLAFDIIDLNYLSILPYLICLSYLKREQNIQKYVREMIQKNFIYSKSTRKMSASYLWIYEYIFVNFNIRGKKNQSNIFHNDEGKYVRKESCQRNWKTFLGNDSSGNVIRGWIQWTFVILFFLLIPETILINRSDLIPTKPDKFRLLLLFKALVTIVIGRKSKFHNLRPI